MSPPLFHKKKFKMGLEIECIVNTNLLNIPIGAYHAGVKVGTWWKSERDGSVFGGEFGEWSKGYEFVSNILFSHWGLKKALLEFKKLFKADQYELSEVLAFNTSTGTHAHVSSNYSFTEKGAFEVLLNARKKFFKMIKTSNLSSKDQIIAQYFRPFAKRVSLKSFRNRYNRRVEFNVQEESKKGLEWRSLNMVGIKTWAEFDEFFKIYYECVHSLLNSLNKYETKKSIRIKVPKDLELNQKIVIHPEKPTEEKITIDPIDKRLKPKEGIKVGDHWTELRRELARPLGNARGMNTDGSVRITLTPEEVRQLTGSVVVSGTSPVNPDSISLMSTDNCEECGEHFSDCTCEETEEYY